MASASSSLGHLFEAGTASWAFVPSISVPIFDAGKNQANLDIARVEKRIEVANYESHPDRVQGSVRCALAGHRLSS
jgi:multidrug efflux system outer membrane protein